jgi:hypothetical protein
MKKTVLSLSFVLFALMCFAQCEMNNPPENLSSENLTQAEINSLHYLREEEYLAGDVYEYLSDLYSLPVFRNISKSEDVHTSRVKALLDAYSLEDPALDHQQGKFKNKELQELYDLLIEKGSLSLDSAIVVGLTIEEKDIKDLQYALENEIEAPEIQEVYEFLLMGSHHHIKAFNFHAKRLNMAYTPKFLSAEEFEAALNH